MNCRGTLAIAAALAVMHATNAAAQGLPTQGEGRLDDEFLRPASSAFVSTSAWQYRFDEPESGWQSSVSSGSGWSQTSLLGFNGGGTVPGDVEAFEAWPSGEPSVWARTTFTVGADAIDELMLWGRWDDEITVYVNGVLAVEQSAWTWSNRYLGLSEAARSTLTANQPNVLAVRVNDTGGGRHLNLQPVLAPELTELPVWGTTKNDELLPVVDLVRDLMSQHGVPAGALSVVVADGIDENNYSELVNVGIGYMDKQFQRQVSPETQFRLASLDKHPVRAAIEDLVAAGQLDWDDNVWTLLAASGVGAIDGAVDPTAASYTLEDIYTSNASLVGYTWDEDFFTALGVTEDTITEADLMSWMFSNPTDGGNCYNPCSDVLRYLVDAVAPGGLETYFSQNWNADFVFGGGKAENRTFDEQGQHLQPWYVTLSDGSLDYHFDAIRILASTARDNSLFWVQNNTPENYYLIWYGGVAGTQTFMRTFRSADNTRQLYVTALFNIGAMDFGDAPQIDGAVEDLVANLPTAAYTTDDPLSWQPGVTAGAGSACFVDADCDSGSCEAGTCESSDTSESPCEAPITLSSNSWTTANFGTTDAICYRINRTIHGLGVANMNGRSFSINGQDMAGQCPAQNGNCSMPLPEPIDGYYYFDAGPGAFPWASIYWW